MLRRMSLLSMGFQRWCGHEDQERAYGVSEPTSGQPPRASCLKTRHARCFHHGTRMRPPHTKSPSPATTPTGLHPRNRHQGHYDFEALVACAPELSAHLVTTPRGERSVDFSRPAAVRALNTALLRLQYGIDDWQLPDGYLCPPVPGRADYLHGLADLLAADHAGEIPRGPSVRVLDIGVGANAIYPLLGHAEYGWRFVGSDIDGAALAVAQRNLDRHPRWGSAIELRLQSRRACIFQGVVRSGEHFELSLCNPPFHASAAEAARGSQRKWNNLGKPSSSRGAPALNFGGQANELWCAGGESAFLRRMIDESVRHAESVGWFTSLVAKAEHLPALRRQLQRLDARAAREVPMAQGNKRSRFLAWSFLDAAQRAALRAPGSRTDR